VVHAVDATLDNLRVERSELNLREIVTLAWDSKWLIITITALFTVAIGGLAWMVAPRYSASVVMSPVTSNGNSSQLGGLSSIGSQLGGLASLAGISLSNDSKKSESLAYLQSDALTQDYIKSHDLLPILYRKIWDPQTRSWTVTDPKKMPTLWKAGDYFKKRIRSVTTDAKTGIVTLTITWKDPKLAAQWANDLVKMANDYLKDQAIAESDRNIAYLTEQAAKTDAIGAKQAIYSLMQSEINREMMARGSDAYALKVIDPAQPPEEVSFPKRALWVIGGFFTGIFFSLLAVFARANWQRDAPDRSI
jgi:uncharacterized protein involved in exopolysaccharide biosynthesis